MGSLGSILIFLLLFALVVFLAFWILKEMALPAPVNMIARVILGVIFLIVLLSKLLPMIGGPAIRLAG